MRLAPACAPCYIHALPRSALACADQALSAAKTGGRDRIEIGQFRLRVVG